MPTLSWTSLNRYPFLYHYPTPPPNTPLAFALMDESEQVPLSLPPPNTPTQYPSPLPSSTGFLKKPYKKLASRVCLGLLCFPSSFSFSSSFPCLVSACPARAPLQALPTSPPLRTRLLPWRGDVCLARAQALGMYRRACRLFPGSHVPLLCMGMEYLKVGYH